MTHMVIFRRPEGKPGYHQADSVEDAIRFVEMLRNQEKVTDARIFRMEEVPVEVRTYYRVELAGASGGSSSDSATPTGPANPGREPANGDAADLAPQEVLDPAPVEAVAARARRFGRT